MFNEMVIDVLKVFQYTDSTIHESSPENVDRELSGFHMTAHFLLSSWLDHGIITEEQRELLIDWVYDIQNPKLIEQVEKTFNFKF